MTIDTIKRQGEVEAEFYKELGILITAKRKQRGWCQQDLAKEIGVHRNTLMRWEAGYQDAPLWMLLRICDILGCQHFLLLPDRKFIWGKDLEIVTRERDGWKKVVQAERDKPISVSEERDLRRQIA